MKKILNFLPTKKNEQNFSNIVSTDNQIASEPIKTDSTLPKTPTKPRTHAEITAIMKKENELKTQKRKNEPIQKAREKSQIQNKEIKDAVRAKNKKLQNSVKSTKENADTLSTTVEDILSENKLEKFFNQLISEEDTKKSIEDALNNYKSESFESDARKKQLVDKDQKGNLFSCYNLWIHLSQDADIKKNIVDHIGYRDDDKLSKLKQLYPQDAINPVVVGDNPDIQKEKVGGGEQLNITADFLSNLYPTFKQLFEKTNRVKFNNLIQESFSEFVKEYAGDQVEKILFDAILFKKINDNSGEPPKIKLLKLLLKHIDKKKDDDLNKQIDTSIAKLIDKEMMKKRAIEKNAKPVVTTVKNPMADPLPLTSNLKNKKGGHRKTCFRKLSTRKRLRPSHFARSTKKVRCRKRATRKKNT